jgi:hypothetical protein
MDEVNLLVDLPASEISAWVEAVLSGSYDGTYQDLLIFEGR